LSLQPLVAVVLGEPGSEPGTGATAVRARRFDRRARHGAWHAAGCGRAPGAHL